jgi:hypothetical protein
MFIDSVRRAQLWNKAIITNKQELHIVKTIQNTQAHCVSNLKVSYTWIQDTILFFLK